MNNKFKDNGSYGFHRGHEVVPVEFGMYYLARELTLAMKQD
jgi:hypothetical protein